MSKKKILIIGAGKRVQSTVLPVLEKLEECVEIAGLLARSTRKIESIGRSFSVESIEALDEGILSGVDLIYMAVTKAQVPAVLQRLTPFELNSVELLIDTPVLCFKHYYRHGLLSAFKNTWATEDCCFLPWFDVVDLARNQDPIGDIQEVEFDRSAYKYHGLATLKQLLGCRSIVRAFRKQNKTGGVVRTIHFSNGKVGRVIEPRDYTIGTTTLKGGRGMLTDRMNYAGDRCLLEPIVKGSSWTGFRIQDLTVFLGDAEVDLLNTGAIVEATTIASRMEGSKRVGLYRLFKQILDGAGGYPYLEALDDMVIDYYLDRLGFYRSNPLMSIKSPIGSRLLHSITRLAGR